MKSRTTQATRAELTNAIKDTRAANKLRAAHFCGATSERLRSRSSPECDLKLQFYWELDHNQKMSLPPKLDASGQLMAVASRCPFDGFTIFK
jgi:hypothetical protein